MVVPIYRYRMRLLIRRFLNATSRGVSLARIAKSNFLADLYILPFRCY